MESARYSGFTWLTAGRKNGSFLLGINNEDLQTRAGSDEVMKFYRTGQTGRDRGDAYQRLGYRGTSKKNGGKGRQSVLRLNRIKVSKSSFNAVRRMIQEKFGQAKASFARTASILLPAKPIPGWIRKQFDAVVANGKTIFDDSQLAHPTNPSITFGSRAKGVQSNPGMARIINSAVEHRKYIITSTINKVFSDYTYNWKTGQVFRTRE